MVQAFTDGPEMPVWRDFSIDWLRLGRFF